MTTIQRRAKALADKYIVDDRDAFTIQKAVEAELIKLLNEALAAIRSCGTVSQAEEAVDRLRD